MPVDEDLAFRWLEEFEEEIGGGGFSRLQREIEAFADFAIGDIAEANAAELAFAGAGGEAGSRGFEGAFVAEAENEPAAIAQDHRLA